MKNPVKFIIAAIVLAGVFFAIDLKAQTTPSKAWRLGLGIETGVPTGVATIGTNFSLGGTARLQYGVSNSFALTLTTGGYHFFPKIAPGTTHRYQSYGEIPVKVGFKEFFATSLYVGGEIGFAGEKLESGWGPTSLDLSPALGYANQHWDFGVHYENFSHHGGDTFGLVNLRVAYGFGL